MAPYACRFKMIPTSRRTEEGHVGRPRFAKLDQNRACVQELAIPNQSAAPNGHRR